MSQAGNIQITADHHITIDLGEAKVRTAAGGARLLALHAELTLLLLR